MFSDKPKTLPLKDFIIKRIAVKMRISESTIDAVVIHQFKEVIKATRTANSIEVAGFGTYHFIPNRAKRFLDNAVSERDKAIKGEKTKHGGSVQSYQDDIDYLENKLYAGASKTDIGGMD